MLLHEIKTGKPVPSIAHEGRTSPTMPSGISGGSNMLFIHAMKQISCDRFHLGKRLRAAHLTILLTFVGAGLSWAGSYRYEVVAITNSVLKGFHSEVSINDSGRVAFIGQETDDYTYFTGIWIADGGGSLPIEVCPSCGEARVTYDYPQINNDGLVVYQRRSSGVPAYYSINLVNPDTGVDTKVAGTRTSGIWSTAVLLPSVSPNIPQPVPLGPASVVYTEIDPIVTPTAINLSAWYSGSGSSVTLATSPAWYTLRSRIANGGVVVAKSGDNATDPITLYQTTGNLGSSVIAGPGFTSLGAAPGISDDGSVVVFYGENAQGPGIFASVTNDVGRSAPYRVSGGLTGFAPSSPDSPIGVTAPQGNPPFFTVVYLATNGDVGGIWSSVVHIPTKPGAPYISESPMAVMTNHYAINDGQIALKGLAQDFEIYDPVNNQDVAAYWVGTDAGDQAIIRQKLWAFGTDLSYAQNQVDSVKAYTNGMRFAYLKATGGIPPVNYFHHAWFDQTALPILTAQTGLLSGAYHFSYPSKTGRTARDEALTFLSVARPFIGPGHLRPALDVEDPSSTDHSVSTMDPNTLAQWIYDWVSYVYDQTKTKPLVYTTRTIAKRLAGSSVPLANLGFDLWLSTDNHDPYFRPSGLGSWDTTWLFMQYIAPPPPPAVSSDPAVDWATDANGHPKQVDWDVFNGTFADLQKLVGTPPAIPPPIPAIRDSVPVGPGGLLTIDVADLLEEASSPAGGTFDPLTSIQNPKSALGAAVSLENGQIIYTAPAHFTVDDITYTLSDGITTSTGDILVHESWAALTATAVAGQSASAAVASTSAQPGVTAVLDNSTGTQPATVAVASYSGNIDPGNVGGPDSSFVDLKASGVTASSSITANFYYPPAIGATTLQYYDSTLGWAAVLGSGGLAPLLNATPNLDGTTSGGRYTVVFDNSSTPSIKNLTGTVFALATVTPPVPGQITASVTENLPFTLPVSELLTNATSLNRGTLAVTAVDSSSAHGGIITFASGAITYTPPRGLIGSDEFTYTLSDGFAVAQGVVTLTIGSGAPDGINKLTIAVGANSLEVRFLGTPGASYVLQWAPSVTGPWSDLMPATTADANGYIDYRDSLPAAARFYRIHTSP